MAFCHPCSHPPPTVVISQFSSHHDPLERTSAPGTLLLKTTQRTPSQSEWKPGLRSVASPPSLSPSSLPLLSFSLTHSTLTSLLCACFRALALAVTSALRALLKSAMFTLSPPLSNCSSGAFSVNPALPPFKILI